MTFGFCFALVLVEKGRCCCPVRACGRRCPGSVLCEGIQKSFSVKTWKYTQTSYQIKNVIWSKKLQFSQSLCNNRPDPLWDLSQVCLSPFWHGGPGCCWAGLPTEPHWSIGASLIPAHYPGPLHLSGSQSPGGHSFRAARDPDVSRKIRRKKLQNFNLQ